MAGILLLPALLLPWLAGVAALRLLPLPAAQGRLALQLGYGYFIGMALLQGTLLASEALIGRFSGWATALVLLGVLGAAMLAARGEIGGALRRLVVSRTRPEPAGPAGSADPAGTTGSTEPAGSAGSPGNDWSADSADSADSVSAALAGNASEHNPRGPTVSHWLFWLALGWIVLHLIPVAVETLYRPIFPWDAWLNWMYRAKAWFLAGQAVPFDEPALWLAGTPQAPYNVDGSHYPTLPVTAALWMAMALGQWSETLVKLPVLAAGIALGLGLYGQARALPLGRTASALTAWLLLSLPLLGTHLSLGGQADIWMCGYAGLGFCALLAGDIRGQRTQTLLGLVLLTLGVACKAEGSVWLLCALGFLLAGRYPRSLSLIVMAAVGGLLLSAIPGLDASIRLPLLGQIGVGEQTLYLGPLGSHRLERWAVLDDYLATFVLGGSWHLLWPLLLLALAALLYRHEDRAGGRTRAAVLRLLLLLAASQALIFGFSAQGRWAEDWTAINRLPLQLAPLLVLALALAASRWQASGTAAADARLPVDGPRLALAGMSLGLLGLLAAFAVYLALRFPAADGPTQAFAAEALESRIGRSTLLASGDRQLTGYQDGIALLSVTGLAIDSSTVDLLTVRTRGNNSFPLEFFWRTAQAPAELHRLSIPGVGAHTLDLRTTPQWRGQISELGLLVYEEAGREVAVLGVELAPRTVGRQLQRLWSAWLQPQRWSQQSVHFLHAGDRNALLPLPLAVLLWLTAALCLCALAARWLRRPRARHGAFMLCLLTGWAVLDLRWSANQWQQAMHTLKDYPAGGSTALRIGDDRVWQGAADRARRHLETANARVLLASADADPNNMRFELLRSKYHLLPAAALVSTRPLSATAGAGALPLEAVRYLLVLQPALEEGADAGRGEGSAAALAQRLGSRLGHPVRLLWQDERALLIDLRPDGIRNGGDTP